MAAPSTHRPPHRPRRKVAGDPRLILLVEDNQVNQMVGSKVLAEAGLSRSRSPTTGSRRSRRSETADYDAILMDCQMPEMDGYQATAAIRGIEGTARHTPIIAMTAAAMEGDRETCLAAGMDDFISKPVRLEAVSEVLRRWTVGPRPSGRRGASPEAAGPAESGRAVPTRSTAHRSSCCSSLDEGEGETLGEIVEEYLTHGEKGWHELRRVLTEGDVESLEPRRSHLRRAPAPMWAPAPWPSRAPTLETSARAGAARRGSGLMEQFDARVRPRPRRPRQLLTAGS